jgi:perosamine synthetase
VRETLAVIPHSRPDITATDTDNLTRVLKSGMIAEGEMCAAFEQQFAAYLGTAGAIAFSTGTLALEMAFRGLGLGSGDKILMPTYLCRAALDACLAVGAEPVLVDCGQDYNIDADQLREMSTRCQAVLIPHMFGIIYESEHFRALNIPIIEDCTHAIGAVDRKGRKVGTFGDISVTSLHATKMLTTGEGGILTSRHTALLKHIRRLKYNDDTGYHERRLYPLSDLQAVLGISQLEKLDQYIEKRRAIAQAYRDGLAACNLGLPDNNSSGCAYFRYPVKISGDVSEVETSFAAFGINIRRPVAVMLHQLLGLDSTRFPSAEKHFRETISLPIYPSLSEEEMQRVIGATRHIFSKSPSRMEVVR